MTKTRAFLAILAILALQGCAAAGSGYGGPLEKHQGADVMREGPGLLTGEDGNMGIAL